MLQHQCKILLIYSFKIEKILWFSCNNLQPLKRQIVDEVRERISEEYVSLNSLAPMPKEDYLKPVVCVMTYVC